MKQIALLLLFACLLPAEPGKIWTKAEAASWYAKQPFLLGANYLPANAINQLEMFQAATWDPARIELEFGWRARSA